MAFETGKEDNMDFDRPIQKPGQASRMQFFKKIVDSYYVLTVVLKKSNYFCKKVFYSIALMKLVTYADAANANFRDGDRRQGIWFFELKKIMQKFFQLAVK